MEDDISRQAELVGLIRDTLKSNIGRRVRVRANLGRSKIVEREGILSEAHRSLFIVETEEKRGRHARQSHQYVDVFTGTVELTDPETEQPLFPMLAEKA